MSSKLKANALTPHQIVKKLDQVIIGQQEAKKTLAIAFRNHDRRKVLEEEEKKEIPPYNILMSGPTGCGKTGLARCLATLYGHPFVAVSATRYTEQGYVGKVVEDMVRDLAVAALSMVKKRAREKFDKEKAFYQDKVDKVILDSLIPPLGKSSVEPTDAMRLNEKTREGYLKKIKQGELDDSPVEIEVLDVQPSLGVISGGPLDEGVMMFANQFMSRFAPPRRKKRKTTVAGARKILLNEEFDRWIDTKNLNEEALEATQNGTIYMDEFDKINSAEGARDSQVSRVGVQRDLVGLIGGMNTVKTSLGEVKTDGILFIAGGAFHNSKPSDLMPELQGRFPVRVKLHGLTKEDLFQILRVPSNSIPNQIKALLKTEAVQLDFTDCALQAIAKKGHQLNLDNENIGARRLISITHAVVKDLLYDTPEKNPPGTTINIDEKFVNQKLQGLDKEPGSNDYFL